MNTNPQPISSDSPLANLFSRLQRGRNTRQKGAFGGPTTGKRGWKRRGGRPAAQQEPAALKLS